MALLVPGAVVIETGNPNEVQGLSVVRVVTSFLGCLNQNTKLTLPGCQHLRSLTAAYPFFLCRAETERGLSRKHIIEGTCCTGRGSGCARVSRHGHGGMQPAGPQGDRSPTSQVSSTPALTAPPCQPCAGQFPSLALKCPKSTAGLFWLLSKSASERILHAKSLLYHTSTQQ